MNQPHSAGLGLASIALAVLATACSNSIIEADFETIGHRGAPLRAAENTLPSFEIALQEGADGIETDLCVTQDDRIVIWHDRDPDSAEATLRQRGVEGLLYVPFVPSIGSPERRPVDELTLDELRAHYGYAKDGERDPDARIPELSEFYNWLSEGRELKALYLDIKLAAGQTEEATFIVQKVFEERPKAGETRVYLMSIHDDIALAMEAERVRLGAEELRVARDFEGEGALEGTQELGLRDVAIGYTLLRENHDYMDEVEDLVSARRDGEIDHVITWTIDDPDDQEALIELGVNGIIANDPAELKAIYSESLADAQD